MGNEDKYQHHPKQYARQRADFSDDEVRRLTDEFLEKNRYLESALTKITPKEFYRDLFPEGSFEIEGRRGDGQIRKPNGIISVIRDADERNRSYNRILFDDLAALDDVIGKEFVITSPVGYSGRRRLEKYAYQIFGIAIDLDYVQVNNIEDLLYQAQGEIIPYPSHVINSGTGLHIYYAFDEPVPAYPRYFKGLNLLKEGLTNIIWNKYTSTEKIKQIQSIFQGYRMPGTQTKISEECLVTAFRAGKHVTVQYLNKFVDESHRADFDDLRYLSYAEAKELYPEWAARREAGVGLGAYVKDYTEKDKQNLRGMYESWKERVVGSDRYAMGARDGNRYYCIGILYTYAIKCGVSVEEARTDALEMLPVLNSLTKSPRNQFTEQDIFDAEKRFYRLSYVKIGLEDIKRKTGIEIPRKKHNPPGKRIPRKKDNNGNSNLKASAWGRRDALYPDGSWRNRKKDGGKQKGRRPKKQVVDEYLQGHPDATPTEISKALGISRTTAYKYLDKSKNVGRKQKPTVAEVKIEYRENFEDRLERLMERRLMAYNNGIAQRLGKNEKHT